MLMEPGRPRPVEQLRLLALKRPLLFRQIVISSEVERSLDQLDSTVRDSSTPARNDNGKDGLIKRLRR
jgi:hypothetical protein